MSAGGGGGEAAGDFDLNIAPIIDCFTVLIAYMLISASFISLGILDVSVSASGDASTPPPAAVIEPPVSMAIQLGLLHKLDIKLTGGPAHLNQTFSLPARGDGEWDTDAIKAKVNEIKLFNPTVAEVNVSAEAPVQYKEMVKIIQVIKSIVPKVFVAS